MPYLRPTLKQLYERIARDFSGHLLDGKALLPSSVLAVLAKVWAGACHTMHGFLAWVFLQVFIDTAEAEFLRRWAKVWGIEPLLASVATGQVACTGAANATLPAGTLWVDKSAVQYTQREDCTLQNGAGTVLVQAVDAGAHANKPAGAELMLVSPVVGVNSTAIVGVGGIAGGLDNEQDESLRERLLIRLRQPPRGGNVQDYIAWAKEISGVTQVFVNPKNQGTGTVGVCFFSSEPLTAPFPSQELVARVQAHLDIKRPVTAEVFVFAPLQQQVTVQVAITPNSVAAQHQVTAALHALFATFTPGQTVLVSHLNAAIASCKDVYDYTLLNPQANIIMPTFTVAVLSAVEFEG